MPPRYDHYKLLGCKPIDKEDQLKAAYKVLVKKWHPDLNPDNREYAEEKMRMLTEAFNVLSNREKRREYDEGPPFVLKMPKFMRKGQAVNSKYLRLPGQPEKSFWDKMKDLMFVKVPEEEERKQMEHDKKMTRQGVDSFIMGLSCLDKKQDNMIELARAEFISILRESPEQPEALYNLGLIEYKLGNYSEALKHLTKAQKHMPSDKDLKVFMDLLQEEKI